MLDDEITNTNHKREQLLVREETGHHSLRHIVHGKHILPQSLPLGRPRFILDDERAVYFLLPQHARRLPSFLVGALLRSITSLFLSLSLSPSLPFLLSLPLLPRLLRAPCSHIALPYNIFHKKTFPVISSRRSSLPLSAPIILPCTSRRVSCSECRM